jgi:acetyl esterase/lipase
MLTINDIALSTEKSHPAQLNAFTQSYQFLLDSGIESGNIIFMGDSAGGTFINSGAPNGMSLADNDM